MFILDRQLCMIALTTLGLLLSEPVEAQLQPQVGDIQTPRFQELSRGREFRFGPLPAVPPSANASPLLINGVPADPKAFPTVYRMTTGGTCTSTLIGQASLMTAAHCVPHGGLIQFELGNKQIRGLCEHARGYDPHFNKSEDWALCLLEFPVIGIRYETVSTAMPTVGTQVVLTGYGCTRQGGVLDRLLRIGVSQLADGTAVGFEPESSTIYTASTIGSGDAILCPGDSGGPLFLFSGNSLESARTVVGVNSRTTFEFGVSLFAATGSGAGQQFFRDWSARHNQLICGINFDQNCR